MNATQLFIELKQAGIQLEADGDRLRFNPKEEVTPDLLERMIACKADLLAITKGKAQSGTVNVLDAHEVWQAVLDRVAGDPEFTPELLEALRQGKPEWKSD